MPYWLMKIEPAECSIDDLAARPDQPLPWTGVRNYQARNFMRDQMQAGDLAFFYHSSCAQPGIAGVVRISSTAYPDASQFDPASRYHDPKSSPGNPRWLCVDVCFERKLPLVPLARLKAHPALSAMRTLQPGNRLSITPVTPEEWSCILRECVDDAGA